MCIRLSSTITPRDRLFELSEMSSIMDHGGMGGMGGIEPEHGVIAYPAHQTSNRYWGISSAADAYAWWDYFMEFDRDWIRSNPKLVEYHKIQNLLFWLDISSCVSRRWRAIATTLYIYM